ncbi:DUF3592 domain-containing protein [Exilibacterium tricleocarpae]|uniref:DUF3592 domain-containing protein n=1 Tax=Exilibacterium tricleocarpae TaxID=2591008 RepID=A0A545TFE1_9GAMM|nr:DUF3592 domain-containing protein [Exilibacterium tricleocarpae]TQV75954.1 DUF3592 domain-containing protein [Exilibacterium tricleocarpae]
MKSSKQTKQSLGIFSKQPSGILSKISFAVKWGPRLFKLVGILFILIGTNTIYQAYKSSSWPSVQGQIISSEIKAHSSTYTDTTTNRTKNETVYDAQINYSYVVNGVTYSNDDVRIGGTVKTNMKMWTTRLLDKYPRGKVVTVYYKPEAPFQSVLEKGFQLSTFALLGMGLFFFIFAIYIRKAFLNLGGMLFGNTTERKVISTTEQSISPNATDPRLLGKWEVVHQIPSYENLAAYSMKTFNFEAEKLSSESVIVPKGKTIVTITENKISFRTEGVDLFGDVGHEYTQQDNRLVLAPVKMNIFMKAMASLIPTYYSFTFSDSKLILTSDKIKGYDNQSITYHLKRA